MGKPKVAKGGDAQDLVALSYSKEKKQQMKHELKGALENVDGHKITLSNGTEVTKDKVDGLNSDKVAEAIRKLKNTSKSASSDVDVTVDATNSHIASFMKAYYTNMKSSADDANGKTPKVIANQNTTELTKRVGEALHRLSFTDAMSQSTVLKHLKGKYGENGEKFREDFYKDSSDIQKDMKSEAKRTYSGTESGYVPGSYADDWGNENAGLRKKISDLAGSDFADYVSWNAEDVSDVVKVPKTGEKKTGKFTSHKSVLTSSSPIRALNGVLTAPPDNLDKITVFDVILAEMENTTFGGKRKTKKAKKSRKSRKARKSKKSRKGGKC